MSTSKNTTPASSKNGLPVKPGGARADVLARIRAATPATVPAAALPRDALLAAALGGIRQPRLVFAMDATASRETAWATARQVTDALLTAIPGGLEVALAVHGGNSLHTWTPWTSAPATLRDQAAGVRCVAGHTCLVDVLERTRGHDSVKVVIYVGDAFEEAPEAAYAAADALRLRGCRAIMLHDRAGSGDERARAVFSEIARRTGGALLDFDGGAPDKLRDLLAAVATLAVGGVKLLEAKAKALPAARLLLEHLGK